MFVGAILRNDGQRPVKKLKKEPAKKFPKKLAKKLA